MIRHGRYSEASARLVARLLGRDEAEVAQEFAVERLKIVSARKAKKQ